MTKSKMEDGMNEEGQAQEVEGLVAPALISVHPHEHSVAVAIGPQLRVYSLRVHSLINLQCEIGGLPHSDVIRAISFGAKGSLFTSVGDDKLVKIWSTESWHCIQTVCSEKRVSAVALNHDGSFLVFADKFGVVWVVELALADKGSSVTQKATPILAHYCSIITSLEFSSDGQFVASADRDFKIRVTVFPRKPLKGAHEIQSFCLGHTDYVSSIAFIQAADGSRGFLLSGSGDSTVRLWDYESGVLLNACDVGVKAGLLDSNVSEESEHPAVTDLCACADGSVIAVAIQRFSGILLLRCGFDDCSLIVSKVVSMQKSFIPTSLRISSKGRIWLVAGASEICQANTKPASEPVKAIVASSFACVKVISVSDQQQVTILEETEVPDGTELLKGLQGKILDEEDEAAYALAAEAANKAMHDLLIKRQYPAEKREFRKRNRNDRKHEC